MSASVNTTHWNEDQLREHLGKLSKYVLELEDSSHKAWDRVRELEAELAEARSDRSVIDRYLGALGFICEYSVYLNNREDANDTIIEILEDAKNVIPRLRWKKMINRFEISFIEIPAAKEAQ